MLRRILIPLDSSPYTESALEMGCWLARSTGAAITGLAVVDLPGIEKSVGSVPLGGIYYAERLVESKKQELLDRVAGLLNRFDQFCRAQGVPHTQAELQGRPSAEIVHESVFHDLVIIGRRTYYKSEEVDPHGDSAEQTLELTPVPIIIVPKSFKPAPKKLNALVAFDGSPAAARSLQRFAQLVNPAEFTVKIIVSQPNEDQAKWMLVKATEYLRDYGFAEVQWDWTSQDIKDAAKERYFEEADMVVLGLHSRHGALDFLIGSFSRFIIKDTDKVLLIGQ
ncbi:MAG: universal stress protein [Calditrichota bacterium]